MRQYALLSTVCLTAMPVKSPPGTPGAERSLKGASARTTGRYGVDVHRLSTFVMYHPVVNRPYWLRPGWRSPTRMGHVMNNRTTAYLACVASLVILPAASGNESVPLTIKADV